MKIKTVEALSFGLPVVTTFKGLTGFPAKIRNGCLIADSPEDFADLIQKLLSDKDFYHQQSQLALDFFLENFEESKVYQQLDEIFLSE